MSQLTEEYFRTTYATPAGRKVLDEIMEWCHVGKDLYAVDKRVQDANVARNTVGIKIKDMVNSDG